MSFVAIWALSLGPVPGSGPWPCCFALSVHFVVRLTLFVLSVVFVVLAYGFLVLASCILLLASCSLLLASRFLLLDY